MRRSVLARRPVAAPGKDMNEVEPAVKTANDPLKDGPDRVVHATADSVICAIERTCCRSFCIGPPRIGHSSGSELPALTERRSHGRDLNGSSELAQDRVRATAPARIPLPHGGESRPLYSSRCSSAWLCSQSRKMISAGSSWRTGRYAKLSYCRRRIGNGATSRPLASASRT